ncbi:hypothetical protein G6F35_016138 [Rhizopus arrhizus]|nr:hypothetical protein G6F35_016138 [Rhizopus arrhizus]
MRQADPGRGSHAREVDGLAHAHAVGQHRVHHASQDQPDQDQEALDHALRVDGDAAYANDGDQGHEGVEARGAHGALGGDRRQVQADDRHDSARHDGRHERIDPIGAAARTRIDDPDDDADQRVGQAAGDDSAQRHADIGVGPAAGIPCDGDHPADEGEA